MIKETSKREAIVSVFVTVIMVILVLVSEILIHAWTLTILWGWFVSATFSVPQISVPASVGITLMAKLVTGFYTKFYIEDSKREILEKLTISFLAPICVLVFAWVVHFFV